MWQFLFFKNTDVCLDQTQSSEITFTLKNAEGCIIYYMCLIDGSRYMEQENTILGWNDRKVGRAFALHIWQTPIWSPASHRVLAALPGMIPEHRARSNLWAGVVQKQKKEKKKIPFYWENAQSLKFSFLVSTSILIWNNFSKDDS